MALKITMVDGSPPDFLTVQEAADVLRIGRTAAYIMAKRFLEEGPDGIPSIRIGRSIRVPRYALETMLGGPIGWPPDAKVASGSALAEAPKPRQIRAVQTSPSASSRQERLDLDQAEDAAS